MKMICGTIVVAVMVSAAVAGGAQDFAGAKWIGGNPVTLPDHDFGVAVWIAPESDGAALTKTVVLPAKPEVAELVVAAHVCFHRTSSSIGFRLDWGLC